MIIILPVFALIGIASAVSSAIRLNFLLIRSCDYLGYPVENCSHLDTDAGGPLETKVQPYVAEILMIIGLIENIIPAILSLFLGPWSDSFGRKPIILCSLIGYCFSTLLLMGYSHSQLPPMYIIFASIPYAVLGGFTNLIACGFCYISDTTDKNNRTFGLATLEAVIMLGYMIGTQVSPYLYEVFPSYRFEGVYTVCFLLCLLTLAYAVFILPESLPTPEIPISTSSLKSVFVKAHVKDVISTCFNRRPGFSRLPLLLLLLLNALNNLVFMGFSSLAYLYYREKFHWTLKEFVKLESVAICSIVFGALLATKALIKYLHFSSVKVLSFNLVFKIVSLLMIAFTSNVVCLYVAAIVGGLGGLISPAARSIMSTLVHENDLGKLFSFVTSVEAFSTLVSSPLYTAIYNSSVDFDPAAFVYFSVFLQGTNLLLIGVVGFILKNNTGMSLIEQINKEEHNDRSELVADNNIAT